MLDHYSYYSAPSKNECAIEILNNILNNFEIKDKYHFKLKIILNLYSKEALLKEIKLFLKNIPHDNFGSYTGWNVSGKDIFTDNFINNFMEKKARNKIIICKLRVIGRFIKMFKNTLETLYAPGSAYERSIKFKYKHLFKTTSNTYPSSSSEDEDDSDYFVALAPLQQHRVITSQNKDAPKSPFFPKPPERLPPSPPKNK